MRKNVGKGMLAGAIAGLVGSIVLRGWTGFAGRLHGGTGKPDTNGPAHRVGALAVAKVTGKPLTNAGRLAVGEMVHYTFGTVVGAVYGGLAEALPWTTAGAGLLFGTGVFVAADESSMPMLGLVKPPWEERPGEQAEHLAAHLVFGVATELTRRGVRRLV